MKTIAIYSANEAALPERTLAAAGIAFDKHVAVSDAGTDEVQLSVAEADFDRAADLLEQLEDDLNANLDLSEFQSCPRCGNFGIRWLSAGPSDPETELLFCTCSAPHPIAFRNAASRRGGLLDAPRD